MSTTREPIERRCPECGHPMERVHMKNPFIDDFEDDCTNPVCDNFSEAEWRLTKSAMSRAKAEAVADRDNGY